VIRPATRALEDTDSLELDLAAVGKSVLDRRNVTVADSSVVLDSTRSIDWKPALVDTEND